MNLHKVFVYGTLKRGEPNHSWFKEENGVSKFLSMGQTVQKFPLIIGTKYNIPFLLYNPGVGHNVIGEIYEVDDKMLANLDILEDHPSYYERSYTDIENLENGDVLSCWTYFIKKFKPCHLGRETLMTYSSSGTHDRPYRERYLRESNYDHKNIAIMNLLWKIWMRRGKKKKEQ